jgi:hypothetical protein
LRGIIPFLQDDRVSPAARKSVSAKASASAKDSALGKVRVVSIPSGHPYPQSTTLSTGISLLPDPLHEDAPEGQWWPPLALDPAWIRRNASAADLLHIHFGTESFSASHLAACITAAHEVGWPVVYTVHDLEHPQLRDQSDYQSQLDVLVAGADAVITLTQGAAREILRRWGRTAIVLPHPAMASGPIISGVGAALPTATSTSFRVGMHLKDLRSNVDSIAMVTALCAAVDELARAGRDVTGEVRIHRSVKDAATRDEIREIVRGSTRGAQARVDLVEHDRLDDAALESAIASLDVAVLPYGHGTHSGWLELCWDLGTGIAVPEVGYYAEQHTDGTVAAFRAEPTGVALASAIATVLDASIATRPETAARAAEVARRASARAAELELHAAVHAGLYRKLIRERAAHEHAS